MYKKTILSYLIVFALGWYINSIYVIYLQDYADIHTNIEKNPKGSELNKNQQHVAENLDTKNSGIDLMKFEELERLERLGTSQEGTRDKPSPHNRIEKEKIFVYDDEVILKVKAPEWAIFTDTKSMEPVIDSTSKAIQIVPSSKEEINVGDIIAYNSKYKEAIVTHRVIEIGYDAFGWYARLKGDNNDDMDPEKVRFEQIKRVVVAIIY